MRRYLTIRHLMLIALIVIPFTDTIGGTLMRGSLIAPFVWSGIISVKKGERFAFPYRQTRADYLGRR